MSNQEQGSKLFIGNLAYGCTVQELRSVFEEETDQILFVNVLKGYGFVQVKTKEEAEKLRKAMDKRKVKDRLINVEFANPENKSKKKRFNKKGSFDKKEKKDETSEDIGWVIVENKRSKKQVSNGKNRKNGFKKEFKPNKKSGDRKFSKDGSGPNGKKGNLGKLAGAKTAKKSLKGQSPFASNSNNGKKFVKGKKIKKKQKGDKFVSPARYWPNPPAWGKINADGSEANGIDHEGDEGNWGNVADDSFDGISLDVDVGDQSPQDDTNEETKTVEPVEPKVTADVIPSQDTKTEIKKVTTKKFKRNKRRAKGAVPKGEKRNGKEQSIQDLKDAMILKLFGYLGHPSHIVNCALVCKRWSNLTNSTSLWKDLCFGLQHTTHPDSDNVKAWKDSFVKGYLKSPLRPGVDNSKVLIGGLIGNFFYTPQLAPRSYRTLKPIATMNFRNFKNYQVETIGSGISDVQNDFPHPVSDWPLAPAVKDFLINRKCSDATISLIYFKLVQVGTSVHLQVEYECKDSYNCKTFWVLSK